MKYVLAAFVISTSFLLTTPAYSMDISSGKVQELKEYSDNVRVIFNTNDKFDIQSDHVIKNDSVTVFSGNVVINSQGGAMKSDVVTVKKQPEGSSLLEASKIILFTGGNGVWIF